MHFIDANGMSEGTVSVPPQSVGVAGGHPSSSYYFVGSQAENLTYLDSHHTRATVPCDRPRRRRLRNVSVGSRLGKPRLRDLHIPATIIPDVACVQPHRLIDVLIPDRLAVALIKTTVR